MVDGVYAKLQEMKQYAIEQKVPIMVDEGIDFLTDFVVKNRVNSVLEIGTAIGYSAIMMALSNPNLKVVSIEKDKERYLEAVNNIKKFKLEKRITLIFNDAIDVNITDKFDLIFIDAAKGRNMSFFEKFENNLNDNGFIVTDNIDFHGLIELEESEIKSRNLRQLVRKIKRYIDFLKNHPIYVTEFYKIGDGIAVTSKRS